MANKDYQLICGLEVHAELKTASKMFCGCKNDPFGAEKPNTHTCPVCLGMPGGLPVPNQKAIEWTIKLGLALNCKVNLFSKFDRKHYFYPDLPKGYQISQHDLPFCYDGEIETKEGKVRIRRIHLEEDTGKLLHTELDGQKVSLVDFNRGGVPLVEIVTEPDIKSAEHAAEIGRKLREIIRYLDIGDCDMQKGGMRLEANLSLSEDGSLPDYKVELKNINSFKFMADAVNYEIKRQTEVLNSGETPTQETRGWDTNKQASFSQRTKENAEDYRYFPDPDIPPLQFTEEQVEEWRSELPILPDEVLTGWESDFGVELRWGEHLASSQAQVEVLNRLFALAKEEKVDSNKIAKELVNKNIKFDSDPTRMLAEFKTLNQTDDIDDDKLQSAIDTVISVNPDAIAKIKAGEQQVMGFLMGQVAQKIGKKLDMKQIRELLLKAIED